MTSVAPPLARPVAVGFTAIALSIVIAVALPDPAHCATPAGADPCAEPACEAPDCDAETDLGERANSCERGEAGQSAEMAPPNEGDPGGCECPYGTPSDPVPGAVVSALFGVLLLMRRSLRRPA